LIYDKIGVTNFSYADLVKLSARHPDQIVLNDRPDKTEIPAGFVGVLFEFNDEGSIQVQLRDSSRAGCPPPLDYLFRCILEKGRYLPVTEGPQAGGSITKAAVFSTILTLPEFNLTDLITAVTAERFFPPGIIRAVSNFRLLDVDFPVSALMSGSTTAQKEAFLRELVILREQTRRTALYEGQIYLLNR
ncbi:MAG: hypothetical protein U9R56_06670, partial [candidate division Zixibacteria bacterium]|nr:hypothetical protein [candidate division Zixibacteria bacterium]